MDDRPTTRLLRFESTGLGVGAHVRVPAAPPPWPGVVIVDGSGPGTRRDDVTLQVVPGADHGLRVADPDNGEPRRVPGVLEGMARWAGHRAAGDRA